MKKITKFLSVVFLLFATWTNIMAQTDLMPSLALKQEQIIPGKKIMFKAISVTNNEWINWGATSSKVTQDQNVFLVVEGGENGIKLQNVATNQFIGPAGNQGAITYVDNADAAAVFTLSTPKLVHNEGVDNPTEVVFPEWCDRDAGYQIRFTTGSSSFLNTQGSGGTSKYANGTGSWSVVMVYDADNRANWADVCIGKKNDKDAFFGNVNYAIYTKGTNLSLPEATEEESYLYKGISANNTPITESNTTVNEPTLITYNYFGPLPFKFSTLSADGQSFEKANWYRVNIHQTEGNRRPWKYNSDNSTITIGAQNEDFNIYSDEQLFCFVGTSENDIKIYNKKAGTAKWATYFRTSEEDEKVNMSTEDTDGKDTWTLVRSGADDNQFCFKTNKPGESECYINNFNMIALKYWSGNDAGSTCYFTSVDVESQLKAKMTKAETLLRLAKGGALGTPRDYTAWENALNAYKENSNAETEAAMNSAFENFENPRTDFNPDLYYTIENYARKYSSRNTINPFDGGLLEYSDVVENPKLGDPQYGRKFIANDRSKLGRANSFWKFEPTGEADKYKLYSLNGKVYIKDGSNSADQANAVSVSLKPLGQAQYNLMTDGTNRLHASGAKDTDGAGLLIVNSGDANSASAWFICPVHTIDITITDAGYATVNYPFAVQLPEGLKAYTGTVNDNKTKFMLKEVTGGSIPAETPVVIEGAKGTYSLTIDYENTEPKIESDLSGTLLSATITKDDYILAKNGSEVGFYMTKEGGALAQNKAYIKSNPVLQGVRGFGFSTEGDGTTGIENTVTETEKEEYYDLQGRRILNPTKGIYVTKSGKKVLFIK